MTDEEKLTASVAVLIALLLVLICAIIWEFHTVNTSIKQQICGESEGRFIEKEIYCLDENGNLIKQ